RVLKFFSIWYLQKIKKCVIIYTMMKDNIEIILRKNGLKVTKPRLEIYKFLKSTYSHPTVEEIFSNVKQTIDKISYATVYNVLNDLIEKGLVKEVSTSEDAKRYDGHIEPHVHLICKVCGKIEDLYIDLSDVEKEIKETGFKVEDIALNVYGICKDCQIKAHHSIKSK
ncbi:Fur family transcriptional regulator, partial [Caldisericum exile]|uniref:Fur family transcriptional regulator n=1 Tax=Caldisericum exile TaxID=693075 RepID=UPI003C710860